MNERSTEGEGACWEGVEMYMYMMCCSMYTACTHVVTHGFVVLG